jgi:hypothetical protein
MPADTIVIGELNNMPAVASISADNVLGHGRAACAD